MRFFQSIEVADEATGFYPQVDKLPAGYTTSNPNSAAQVQQNYLVKLSGSIDFRLSLNPLAKLTDILSCTYLPFTHGILCNEKVINIYNRYKIYDHQKYFVRLYQNEKEIREAFFWLHNHSNVTGLIDFFSSEIVSFNPFSEQEIKVNIYTLEDFMNFRSTDIMSVLKFNRLILKQFQFDLFRIKGVNGYILSEPLAEEIMKHKVSGIKLVEADYISVLGF